MNEETEVKPDETLDCIGLFCPIPVFNTTEAINTINIGEVQGAAKVEKAVLEDQTEGERLEIIVDAVVLATEMVPNVGLIGKLGVEVDESGFVKTDKYQRTSLDGVYAIGNVASEIDLLVVAEAQGTIVAHDAYRRLRVG